MGRNIEEIQWCSMRGLDSETLEEKEGEKDVWSWRECSQTLDYPFNEATRCHCFITKRKWERSRFHGVCSSFPTAWLASALSVPSVIPSRRHQHGFVFPALRLITYTCKTSIAFWHILLKLLSANYHPNSFRLFSLSSEMFQRRFCFLSAKSLPTYSFFIVFYLLAALSRGDKNVALLLLHRQ